MSNWSATIPYSGMSFKETCPYCGCVYKVETQLQDGHNDREEYWCPECSYEKTIRACITPTVTKISGRTDGRTTNAPRKNYD